MLRCAACGTANSPEAGYCLSCGTALPRSEDPETRRTVTIVFSDVVGSTSLGERLDAEAVRAVMSRYFTVMRAALEAHGGTVEKFIGDAVMAVFGVPQIHEDDALRAVRGAAEMRARLEELSAELVERFGVGLSARTGVNTGEVVAGDPARGESFVAGDPVNLAARLEQAAAPGEILLGPETHGLVRDAVAAEAVEPLQVKGKAEPVRAFRLVRSAPDVAEFPARHFDTPLVGRTEELLVLRDLLEESRQERSCRLVTLSGAAGIGKSRLAQELVASAEPDTAVLRGRCLPYGDGITFWPLAEVLKAAAGIGEREARAEAEDKLRTIVPADAEDAETILDRIAVVIGLRDSTAEPGELFWATRRVLESLAGRRPLIVALDDLQWGEPTLLDFVEYLGSFSRGAPMLLLCLARTELLESRPGWTAGIKGASTLRLEPLGTVESRQVMEQTLGGAPLPADVSDHLTRIADGNPLFAEELARMLVSDGSLQREEQAWVATRPVRDIAVPASVRSVLAARLAGLTVPERGLLERGSVIGEVFWWGAVSELAPPPWRPDVPSHLQALTRSDLIRPDESSFAGEDAFRFSHVLIRDAAYGGMLRDLRAQLHERFAAWLERRVAGRVEEYEEIIGYHLEQAFRQREALGPVDADGRRLAEAAAERLAAAGRRAVRRGDTPAVINLLERALALWSDDAPQRLPLIPELAMALVDAGDLDRAGTWLSDAVDEARARGNELVEWRARLLQADLRQTAALQSLADCIGVAEAAVAAFERLDSPGDLARAWAAIGRFREWLGHTESGLEACEEARRHARRAGDRRAEGAAVDGILMAMFMGLTPADAALRRAEEILSDPATEPPQRAMAHALQAPYMAMVGRFDEGRAASVRARTLYEEYGLLSLAAGEACGSAWGELMAGRPDLAERRLQGSCDALRAMGAHGFLSTLVGYLAEAVYRQGRHAEAEELAQECRAVATDDDIDAQSRWRRIIAKVSARRGEYEEGERLAREAVALLGPTEYINDIADAHMDLAEVLRLAGKHSDAAETLATARALYVRKGNVVCAQLAEERLATVGS